MEKDPINPGAEDVIKGVDADDGGVGDVEKVSPDAEDPHNESSAKGHEQGPDSRAGTSFNSINPQKIGIPGSFSDRLKGVYEKAMQMSGAKRLVGKIGVAFNNKLIERGEDKNLPLKTSMEAYDNQLQSFEKNIQEQQKEMEELKQSGDRVAALQIEINIKKLENQRDKAIHKRDRVQTKFEKRDNKIGRYTRRRDAIAEDVIGSYEKMSEPLENELSFLEGRQRELSFEGTMTRANAEEGLQQVEADELKLQVQYERYTSLGLSKRKAAKMIKPMQQQLTMKREKFQGTINQVERRKSQVDNRIIKADKKCAPYRDVLDEFRRAQKHRPVDMEVDSRERVKEQDWTAEAKGHTREDPPEEPPQNTDTDNEDENTPSPENDPPSPETREAIDERPSLEEYTRAINAKLKERGFSDNDLIDEQQFYEVSIVDQYKKYNKETAKKIMKSYYTYIKQSAVPNNFNAVFDEVYPEEE